MNTRTTLKIAALGLALFAIAGKSWWSSRHAGANATVSTQGVAIVQRAGERGFTLGSLAFTPCELDQRNSAATTAAFCAPFQVPENRDRPDGRRIDLKLALIRGCWSCGTSGRRYFTMVPTSPSRSSGPIASTSWRSAARGATTAWWSRSAGTSPA